MVSPLKRFTRILSAVVGRVNNEDPKGGVSNSPRKIAENIANDKTPFENLIQSGVLTPFTPRPDASAFGNLPSVTFTKKQSEFADYYNSTFADQFNAFNGPGNRVYLIRPGMDGGNNIVIVAKKENDGSFKMESGIVGGMRS